MEIAKPAIDLSIRPMDGTDIAFQRRAFWGGVNQWWDPDEFFRKIQAAEPFVAEAGPRRIVGLMLVQERKNILHIIEMLVDPKMRRRGVGSSLVRHAAILRHCPESKLAYSALQMTILESDDAAKAFLAKNLFQHVDTVERVHDDGNQAVMMRRA